MKEKETLQTLSYILYMLYTDQELEVQVPKIQVDFIKQIIFFKRVFRAIPNKLNITQDEIFFRLTNLVKSDDVYINILKALGEQTPEELALTVKIEYNNFIK